MKRAETIIYIRKIKKDLKKDRHNSLSQYGYSDIMGFFEYPPLEIAARFLRRKGYSITIRIYNKPIGPLLFGKPLSTLRCVSIIY